ncbi:SDR family NAD(P)-dependent oxidoreductase [Denitratisoma oestradiolicum]|uniref:3-alpha-(Or 20-beta)-hydroxysteroid dehydrogenase n=1 Tax=Denitratisoma oestradiolicum TaxID=311182 RepID=A0A6S6XX87_9PROT|nr:SDR family NAD(P)-dependent oxidoreductase [Denitratisoma oestradiolicum]TWO81658.1 3-oxoacyl-ACP reductase [Denitratisoma oestradiolicum]CAB1370604.1 3-alpha-(or 20-beta)-hydroxysteroid dehydrogenase [Denitratisoma oestradiolicum]
MPSSSPTAYLTGRVALVTGGTSGIGAATVRELIGHGARVMIAGIEDEAGAAMVTELCATHGADTARYVHADVSVLAEVETMVAAVEQAYGRLDILVNNAGVGNYGETPDLAPEQWERVLGINLNSIFYGCKFAIPLMRRQGGGAIVNIASISGMAADYGFTAYAASKGAAINYTRALALDHARDHIRVNAVCPGLIETPLTAATLAAPAVRETWSANVPLNRPGRPEEIAKLVRFLASDDASYMTGAIIPVDGGLTAWTGQPNMPKVLGLV